MLCRRLSARKAVDALEKRRKGEVTDKVAETIGLRWVWQEVTQSFNLKKTREGQYSTNRKLTYNLIRWRAASHSALQFALGVLDGMLCSIRCDDRRAWYQVESTNEI